MLLVVAGRERALISVAAVVVAGARREPSTGRGRSGGAGVDRARGSSARSSLAGVLDVVGLVSFAVGLESAPTWMVGLASSFGPAVTIIIAVAFLGERLKPIQWVGLAGIAVGMVAIAIPSTRGDRGAP